MTKTALRDLPQIQAMLDLPALKSVSDLYSAVETKAALRTIIADLREAILSDEGAELPDFHTAAFADTVAATIKAARTTSLRSVINATGILIHTNLGRAALAPQARAAMDRVAGAPSNLEFDLETGKRGSRHDHVAQLICDLTGAEAAVVVNNCAAAVLLSLMTIAQGRHVVASRGELIEIGGAFRLPDVISQSGAVLREVGTTNKTRLSDYEDAIGPDTAVLLKSHTSNFKIVGFTAAPDRRALARLAQEKGVVLIEDLGSGVLRDLTSFGLRDEPVVSDIIKSGVDLVMFSGDKLLGGPQAGIIAGRAEIIAALKQHPLMRAVRVDKLSLAALEATLRLYKPPFDPFAEIPVLQMLSDPLQSVQARGRRLVEELHALGVAGASLMKSKALVGAGAMPEEDLPSYAVALTVDGLSAEGLSRALRSGPVPIISRIESQKVMFDMRTVRDADFAPLLAAIQQITAS